jgi:hypothetical protein
MSIHFTDLLITNSYRFAGDIDENLQKHHNFTMDKGHFCDLVEILSYPSTIKGQEKFYKILSALPPVEIIKKIIAVSGLIKILVIMKKNSKRVLL